MIRAKLAICSLAFTSIMVCSGRSQSRVLKATNPIQVPSAPMGAVYLPVHCDTDGRIYYRNFENGRKNSGVVGVSSDGSNVVKYELPTSGKYEGTSLHDFAVTKTSGVMLIAQDNSSLMAVELDSTGKVVREVPVAGAGYVSHYAVIGQDQIAILGNGSGPSADSERIATLDLNKRAFRTNDTVTKKFGPISDSSQGAPSVAGPVFSEVESGMHGETYYLSGTGDVRLMKVVPGSPDVLESIKRPVQDAVPMQLLVAKGKVGIVFQRDTMPIATTYISILTSDTMSPLTTYTVEGLSAGLVSCMTDSSISFIARSKGHLVIKTASIQ